MSARTMSARPWAWVARWGIVGRFVFWAATAGFLVGLVWGIVLVLDPGDTGPGGLGLAVFVVANAVLVAAIFAAVGLLFGLCVRRLRAGRAAARSH